MRLFFLPLSYYNKPYQDNTIYYGIKVQAIRYKEPSDPYIPTY